MGPYILRRLLIAVPSLLGISVVLFTVLALAQGVAAAHIVDGRHPHSLLLEVFTDAGIGTMVVGRTARPTL